MSKKTHFLNTRRSFNVGLLSVALGALTAGASFQSFAQQQPIEIKLGHVSAPGSLYDLTATEFAKRANARLGNKAKVVVFGSSQLGGDKEMVQKLKLGTLDLSIPSSVMSSESDLFGIFELPYLVQDRTHMKRISKEVVKPYLIPAAEKKGLRVLGVWENGYRHITNNKKPIVTPDDLKGIKLRVPEGKWRVRMFQDYGANPSPMKFSELFTALQTGVMDGQENPLTQIYSSKLNEAQKYISMSGHVYVPAYLTAGSRKWEKLPADVRKILEETAIELEDYAYQMGEKGDNELLGKITASGKTASNEVDKKAFVGASKQIYSDFGKEVKGAQALIDKVNSLR